MLLLQEAESPAQTTDRDDDAPSPRRVQLRQLRLTQNQIRLSESPCLAALLPFLTLLQAFASPRSPRCP